MKEFEIIMGLIVLVGGFYQVVIMFLKNIQKQEPHISDYEI